VADLPDRAVQPEACERCNVFMSDPPEPCPATGNRQPCRAASQERPQPDPADHPGNFDGYRGNRLVVDPLPSGAQERPSIDVALLREAMNNVGLGVPYIDADPIGDEHAQAVIAEYLRLSSPEPVEPGE
jgi:hypothetical protein